MVNKDIDNTIEEKLKAVLSAPDGLESSSCPFCDYKNSERQVRIHASMKHAKEYCEDYSKVGKLSKLIQSESMRHADERVREFASWCDLDQEVIFNHPHFIQDYAEQFINQNTESEKGEDEQTTV